MATKEPIYRIPPDYTSKKVSVAFAETLAWPWKFLGVEEIWLKTQGLKPDGTPVKIAVGDTGVDLNHPELVDQILEAKDFTGSKYGPQDKQGHGSWCNGALCAKWRNNTGGAGIVPLGKLLSGKCLNDQGYGNDRAIADFIEWACEEDADFISMSLGGRNRSPIIEGAIRAALKFKPRLFIFAASGNDGGPVNYPGALPGVIGVGASDENGRITSFTSRGPELDIIAPGKDIVGCDVGGYQVASGTSMATPIACGIAALAFALDPEGFTNAASMEQKLRDTAGDSGPWRILDPKKLVATHQGMPDSSKPLVDINIAGFRIIITKALKVSPLSKISAMQF